MRNAGEDVGEAGKGAGVAERDDADDVGPPVPGVFPHQRTTRVALSGEIIEIYAHGSADVHGS